jgi:hypothetical protein
MKIPVKVNTSVTPLGLGLVQIWHTQSIKQNLNYQSADASYGISIICRDSLKEIKQTLLRSEQFVEDALIKKVKEHQQVLQDLSK